MMSKGTASGITARAGTEFVQRFLAVFTVIIFNTESVLQSFDRLHTRNITRSSLRSLSIIPDCSCLAYRYFHPYCGRSTSQFCYGSLAWAAFTKPNNLILFWPFIQHKKIYFSIINLYLLAIYAN